MCSRGAAERPHLPSTHEPQELLLPLLVAKVRRLPAPGALKKHTLTAPPTRPPALSTTVGLAAAVNPTTSSSPMTPPTPLFPGRFLTRGHGLPCVPRRTGTPPQFPSQPPPPPPSRRPYLHQGKLLACGRGGPGTPWPSSSLRLADQAALPPSCRSRSLSQRRVTAPGRPRGAPGMVVLTRLLASQRRQRGTTCPTGLRGGGGRFCLRSVESRWLGSGARVAGEGKGESLLRRWLWGCSLSPRFRLGVASGAAQLPLRREMLLGE